MDQSKYRCQRCLNEIDDRAQPCPNCGWHQDTPAPEGALTPETVLVDRYQVGRAAYQNAECVVYAAFDREEDARVWLREFCPHSLVRRSHTSHELMVLPEKRREFEDWKEDFRQLYTDLHKMGYQQGITPVLDVFEWGGSVYVVEKYIASISLRDHLAHSGGSIAAPAAKRLFLPMFSVLSRFHGKGFVHGGICLDSLYLDARQNLWLRSGGTRQLPLHELGGPSDDYFPLEQHDPNAFWSPATDIYSLGAVLYRTLTGTCPTGAEARRVGDRLLAPIELDPDIPEGISDAVVTAMALDKADRPQSVDALSALLLESEGGSTAVFVPPTVEEEVSRPTVRTIFKMTRNSPSVAYFLFGAALVFLMLGFLIAYLLTEVLAPVEVPQQPEDPSNSLVEQQPEALPEEISTVPSFVGTYIVTVQENRDNMKHYRFTVEEVFDETYPAQVICRQEPRAGKPLPENGKIVLYVSRGSAFVAMPDLVGGTEAFAIAELSRLNIKYNLEYVVNLNYPDGTVLEASQEPGTELRRFSSEVTLKITR